MRLRSRYVLGASVLALFALLGLTHLDLNGPTDGAVIDPDDPAQVSLGEEIYAAQCASCHGEDLQGQPDWQSRHADGTYPAPPHDDTGHTWHHADALLFDYTKRGGAAVIGGSFKSNMPGFGDHLTDDEIRAVIAFIKSTWPPQIRQRQEQRNADG
jgi:mono/diheme cytochrome c family protein